MEKFELIKLQINRNIKRLTDSLPKVGDVGIIGYHTIIKIHCESFYKGHFELQILNELLETKNIEELKEVISSYIELFDRKSKSPNILSSTTNMVYNLTSVWDLELFNDLRITFENYLKQLN
jgi:hypothetical protein